MFRYFLFFALFCFGIHAAAQSRVFIIGTDKVTPANAKKLGSLTIGNNSTKLNCNYETAFPAAILKVKEMGGNLLKITKVDSPAFISSCYRFHADVLFVVDTTNFATAQSAFEKWFGIQIPEDTAHYALVYTYMLPNKQNIYGNYLVRSDIGNMGRMSDNTRYVTKVYKQGKLRIWAFTEKKGEIFIDVQAGQTYYIKCLAKPGSVTGVPGFMLMPTEKGKEEYNSIKE